MSDKKRIYMTGANGKLGKYFLDCGVLPLSGNITDLDRITQSVRNVEPDYIIHAASVSDVEECESVLNRDRVINVNLRGTSNVLNAAEQVGAKVIFLSTDHIFDGRRSFWAGKRGGPYAETAKPNPVNFYGYSKFTAEALHHTFPNMKIVRTSYLFDKERLTKEITTDKSYPTFMYRSFMYMGHFADNVLRYISNFDSMPTILHISGSQTVSWDWFASEWLGMSVKVHTTDQESSAPRPFRAGLKTMYPKLLPQYSYLDGFKEIR